MNENKLQYNVPGLSNFKFVDSEEYDGHAKSKKLRTSKDTALRRAPSVTHSTSESEGTNKNSGKNNIKNTYINKINHLISDEKSGKEENEKRYKISLCSITFQRWSFWQR
jgi:hypothetical protein